MSKAHAVRSMVMTAASLLANGVARSIQVRGDTFLNSGQAELTCTSSGAADGRREKFQGVIIIGHQFAVAE